MKIKPEHLEHMRSAIRPIIDSQPEILTKYREAGLTDKRFRWDALWAAKISPWISENLYPYCNDEHIDTALRNIVPEASR